MANATPTPAAARLAPQTLDDRPLRPALKDGWRRRCPACGTGAMMAGYLRVADACPHCGEALHHHRADDGPAYLTILVVGKVVMAVYLWVFMAFQPAPLVMIALCGSLAIGLSLWLLPRFKGAMVALQWSRRMDGFGNARRAQ
ncbi:MAG: DUF983 domain-containing protein [Pararhodobacter sp.]